MSKSDLQVIIIIILFLTFNIIVVIFGYFTHKLASFIPMLSIMMGIASIFYWLVKSLKVKVLYIESREVIAFFLEILVIGFAVYALLNKQAKTGINIINYISYGLHILALIGMLIFILTVKFNRLI